MLLPTNHDEPLATAVSLLELAIQELRQIAPQVAHSAHLILPLAQIPGEGLSESERSAKLASKQPFLRAQ